MSEDTELKLCKNCKYWVKDHYPVGLFILTCRAGLGTNCIDTTTGEEYPPNKTYVPIAIMDARSNRAFGPCGLDAKFFVDRTPEDDNWGKPKIEESKMSVLTKAYHSIFNIKKE